MAKETQKDKIARLEAEIAKYRSKENAKVDCDLKKINDIFRRIQILARSVGLTATMTITRRKGRPRG